MFRARRVSSRLLARRVLAKACFGNGPIAAGLTRSTPLRAPPLFSNLIHTTAVRMDTRTLSMPCLRRISNEMSKIMRHDFLTGPTLSPTVADMVCTG